MRRFLCCAMLFLSLGIGVNLFRETAAPSKAAAPLPATQTIQLNGHTFTLPTGFTIELAVRPGLIQRPITITLDEQGRLYVADSSGSNDPPQKQLKERTHRIVRLEDSDDDGVYDRATTFADRMMFPEGTLWYDGSLYVAAPPSIWKLTDTNADGIADQRVEWFQGKTLTGCANDLHGPYLGLDGRIYWTKGAFAEQSYTRTDGSIWKTRAAHLFRARVDGRDFEPVMTGGMDNPVDIVFTPTGERIFTTTFFQHPGGGQRDGLIHAIYGGVYGKDHGPIYEHPWTAPTLMPVLTHMGPAAPSGLTRYESQVFGREYQDNLFVAQFNLQKISRHELRPSGATFTTRDSDFLLSDNRDFHPTDVIEDADGSLLVVDTGGWYKLCCPSSQLVKTDIHGAIYRIRRVGAKPLDDPRGRKIDWNNSNPAQLAELLDDVRPAVVHQAMQVLSQQGSGVLPALAKRSSETARRNAVWTATRIDHVQAREFVRRALVDPNSSVRQAALHAVSLWRDGESLRTVVPLLDSESMHVRRVAAEALGRIGSADAVPALLRSMTRETDRVLEHALIYALIEIGDADGTQKGLTHADPKVRRAALTALDQMGKGKLQAESVIKELVALDTPLRETAWWIAGRHPEWGDRLAELFRTRLSEAKPSPELVEQLARFVRHSAIQSLLAERLAKGTSQEKLLVLSAMARSRLKPVPALWLDSLLAQLESEPEIVRATLTTLRVLSLEKSAKLTAKLLELADQEKHSVELRLAALAAVPGGLTAISDRALPLILAHLTPDQPVVQRALAVEILTRSKLARTQQVRLIEKLPQVGPMELDRLVDVFSSSNDSEMGLQLLQALRSSPVRSSLRVDSLKARLTKFDARVQQAFQELYTELNAELLQQHEQLDRTLQSLKPGDIRRGQAVFNSQKAGCSACHAIGYLGGKIGPDLTRIGSIRSERDLLESILFPSASLVRSYEPVRITTVTGKSYNGIVKQESPEELVLTLNALEEVRLPRHQIEEMEPSKVSIMPGGLEKILTAEELADLLAFLKACK